MRPNSVSPNSSQRTVGPSPVVWSAVGVSFTILAALSAFVYGTLSKDQSRLDAAILKTFISTKATLSTGQSTSAKLNPIAINASIGYTF